MAVTLNGTTQYLSKASALVSGFPLSYATWFNSASAVTNQVLIGVYTSAPANGFVMDVNAGLVRAFSGLGGTTASTSTSYTANTWNLASCSFTDSTNAQVYLNGAGKGTTGTVGSPVITQTYIGAKATATIFFGGLLAFSAIWSVSLSDAEHLALAGGLHPLRMHPGALKAVLVYIDSSLAVDLVSGTVWTLTGTPTVGANPLIYTPTRQFVPPITVIQMGSVTVGAKAGLSTSTLSVDLSGTLGAKAGLSPAKLSVDLSSTVGSRSGLSVAKLSANLGATLGAKSGLSTAKIYADLSAVLGTRAGLSTAKLSALLLATVGSRSGLSTAKITALLKATTGTHAGISSATLNGATTNFSATLGAKAGLKTALLISLIRSTLGVHAGISSAILTVSTGVIPIIIRTNESDSPMIYQPLIAWFSTMSDNLALLRQLVAWLASRADDPQLLQLLAAWAATQAESGSIQTGVISTEPSESDTTFSGLSGATGTNIGHGD